MYLGNLQKRILYVVTALAVLLPFSAFADASLSFSPSTGSYAVGKTFTVQVMADSDQSFNSANCQDT
jgi:hypothetical protein